MEWLNEIMVNFSSPLSWRTVLAGQFSSLAFACFVSAFFLSQSRIGTSKVAFAWSLLPIAMISAFIAGIISSSVALSLGFVGSISIIRFRTLIHENGNLIIVFIVMAGGLGIGLGNGLLVWMLSPAILGAWALQNWVLYDKKRDYVLTLFTQKSAEVLNQIRNLNPRFHLQEFHASPKGVKMIIHLRQEEVVIQKFTEAFSLFPEMEFSIEEESEHVG